MCYSVNRIAMLLAWLINLNTPFSHHRHYRNEPKFPEDTPPIIGENVRLKYMFQTSASYLSIRSGVSIWHSPAELELKGLLLVQLPKAPPPVSSPLFSQPLVSVKGEDSQKKK